MTEEKKSVGSSAGSAVGSAGDERRYAIITKESIKMMAESAGHSDISDTVAGILGEDVSYRLREITQKSAQFMRHAKRRRMNTVDFNKACRQSDIQSVNGHSADDAPSPFHQTREGEIHFVEDPDTNLATAAFNGYMPKYLGDTTIKAHWLVVEGVQKTPQNPQGTPVNTKPEVSSMMTKYFDKITEAIMGSDSEMMKTALSDIRSNRNISSLLPHFVSFISNGVKTVSHNIGQLTRILHTVHSLVRNHTLFLDTQPYLNLLLQSVQFCLLEPLTVTVNGNDEQWTLRDYAARILAHLVSIWGNSVNHLERFTEKTLREVLYDHTKPFYCHYGAVMGLLFLGIQSLERVLTPHLRLYMPHLTSAMDYKGLEGTSRQSDAYKVYGAILLCVEHILKVHIQEFMEEHVHCKQVDKNTPEHAGPPQQGAEKLASNTRTKKNNTSGFVSVINKSPCAFYKEVSEYFGDALSMRLPELLELKSTVFKPKPAEVVMSLSDAETSKTGEQLLEELMEQVRQQEEINRKQKAQDRYIQEKHAREMQDKLTKKTREYEQRMADHRQQLQLAYQKKCQQSSSVDSDDEIDVEGVTDKVDGPYNQSSLLAVKSTNIGSPGQGIKLTFTKRPKLSLNFSGLSDSPQSEGDLGQDMEARLARKRKHDSKSPIPNQSSLFEFEDISDYEAAPSSYQHLGLYSSEGEGSSDGGSGRKSLTMKFKKRDITPD